MRRRIFFSARSFRRDDFPTVALATVFRQLGDDRMAAILNEIREGVLLGHAQEHASAVQAGVGHHDPSGTCLQFSSAARPVITCVTLKLAVPVFTL